MVRQEHQYFAAVEQLNGTPHDAFARQFLTVATTQRPAGEAEGDAVTGGRDPVGLGKKVVLSFLCQPVGAGPRMEREDQLGSWELVGGEVDSGRGPGAGPTASR